MQIDHTVQLSILKQLLYKPKARFRDLNTFDLTNDHFTFHIKRLIDLGLVDKISNLYKLTPTGLEIAGRLDLEKLQVIKQPKVGVLLCVTRKKLGVNEVLLEERLRDPSKGKIGFHTEKVHFGESLQETVKRCLEMEIGFKGKYTYIGAVRMIKVRNSSTVTDVLLNYFKVNSITGALKTKTKESRNFWVKFKDANKLKNTHHGFKKDLDHFKLGKLFFEERISKY
jgi:ADP-ribose pyrophosphatase YjhB (NUDIX family)